MIARNEYGVRMTGFNGNSPRAQAIKSLPTVDGRSHDPWPVHATPPNPYIALTTTTSGAVYGEVDFNLHAGGFYYFYHDQVLGSGDYVNQGFPLNYIGEFFNAITRGTLYAKVPPDQIFNWLNTH